MLDFIIQHTAILSLIVRIATLLLVVIGWFVVDRRNNKRETRKECRQLLIKCEDIINNTIEYAKEYHTADAHLDTQASRIKFQLQRLASYINSLSQVNLKIGLHPIIQFRQSITFDNFDTKTTFKKQPLNSDLIENIEQAGCILTEELERSFYQSFKP